MTDKLSFLLNEYLDILRNMNHYAERKWGKMNVQQMIEHMTESVKEANGKTPRTLLTGDDRLPKMYEFLMSEKEFKPETKNVLMGEVPEPVKHASVKDAIDTLENELKDFEKHYEKNPEAIITNPFFGHLNYIEWTQLLHKHAIHHLKQFGV